MVTLQSSGFLKYLPKVVFTPWDKDTICWVSVAIGENVFSGRDKANFNLL